MPIISGDDRRRLVPLAVVQVLTCLIDETELPSYRTVELRSIRSRLCRVFGLPDPQGAANASDVAQGVAEEDGDPQDL